MVNPFHNPDAWSGGTFDALMFFGPTSLGRAVDTTCRIWGHPQLNGPYRDRNTLTSLQPKADPSFTEDGCEQLVGEYRHPDGAISPFVQTTIFDDDGLWIYVGIPMGGFPDNWNVGTYPFDDGKPVDWVIRLTDDLKGITDFVRISNSVLACAYGWFDVSILDTIGDALNGKINADRWHHLELQTQHGWQTYPITKLEPLFTDA